MMQYNYSDIRNPEYKPVVVKDNILQRRAPSVVTCEDEFTPISKEEFIDTVSPGDGGYKLVYAINGQIPGPDIVVYEDQVISVSVRNQLRIEALSIHWHGMIQRATPWMDGASMISQCPILPGQTFQYRFLASPSGTHWYHGHIGTMRSDGIAGALIVLPRIRPRIHMLIIVAFDGHAIEPFKADSVVIQPAERVPIIHPDRTHAVLNYYGEDDEREPRIMPRPCCQSSPCVAVNRVYGPKVSHGASIQLKCKPTLLEGGFQCCIYICYGKCLETMTMFPRGPQINGRRFVKPTSPLQTYPGVDVITPCGTCESNECDCTHIIKFGLGNIIEIVIFSFGDIRVSHPVHIHGHHFHVLKTGYPPYNPVTGNATGRNPDIRCLDEFCTEATWADPSWNSGHIPGINLENPPVKDTVSVPANGYVIIRLKADNPGFWLLHCHFANHHLKGMALVIQEGEVEDMAPIPPNFPTCSDFQFSAVQWQIRVRSQRTRLASRGIIPDFKSGLALHSELQNDDPCRLNPWMCKMKVY
ncbi:uncharacterized protein LOC125656390 [Ostrea edulis]|uniref:uncharacterized protein LOC125656390 n=1 Tax=Ostrea edulis TaxID=37623 RepID=UPI0024AF1535|nr:uncharacterized protein LOC125656390 [Ostrea edulis]